MLHITNLVCVCVCVCVWGGGGGGGRPTGDSKLSHKRPRMHPALFSHDVIILVANVNIEAIRSRLPDIKFPLGG